MRWQQLFKEIVPGSSELLNHAFFEWKLDAGTKVAFTEYDVPYATKMKSAFNAVLYL
jgi:hypothetical protein